MGGSAPRGPSDAQIKTEAQLEEERVKFENERRQFLERVGSYELVARNNLTGERGSFDTADWIPMDSSGLFIPQRFDPSFNPGRYPGQDLSWFSAPNLGINYTPPAPQTNQSNNAWAGFGNYGIGRNRANT
jgi:hypothetical protein